MLRQKLLLTTVVISILLSAFAFTGAEPSTDASTPARTIQSDSEAAFSEKTAQFEGTLEDLRRQLKIPGMSAAIVKDQELVWAQGFGYADLEAKREATPDTPYELASLTKIFTSTILLQLVEQGKLDLDDPISQYGVRIKSPGEIRVSHLLSHTSEGMPGSHFHYQGYRYGHLSKVIERASGHSFEVLLTENILKPLSMADSAPIVSLDEPEYTHIAARLARPYRLDETYQVIPGIYEDHFTTSAGLVSTVVDMARYDIALDRNELISKETKEMAFTPFTLSSGRPSPYGLGWFVQDFQGTRLIWHYGNNPPSFSTLILKIPEHGLTLIAFANTANLSTPFWLGEGNVMDSPIAVAFYKLFIIEAKPMDPALEISWDTSQDEIIAQLGSAQAAGYSEILKQELVTRYLIHNYFNDVRSATQMLDLYASVYAEPAPAFDDLTPIAAIEQVGDNQYSIVEFTLDDETLVQIYSVGEYAYPGMADFGGIENVDSGKLIWYMTPEQTAHAGGSHVNRQISTQLKLKAGTYRLHYRTDGGHSSDKWLLFPPDSLFWGIALYSASDDQAAIAAQAIVPAPKDKLLVQEPVISTFEYFLLWSYLGIFLSAMILWPAGSVLRRFTKPKHGSADVPKSRLRLMRTARWVAGLNSLLCLFFALVIMLSFGLEFMALHSVTSSSSLFIWERSLLGIPYLSILLTILQVVLALIAWNRRFWSLPGRLHYSVVTVAAISYLLLLNEWRLIVALL